MCIAIVKPPSATLPPEHLTQSWIGNPDGAGYAFVKDEKVVIRKGYMKLKEFLASYNADLIENKDSTFLVHFRIRTLGEKDEANTHPFPIEGGALIHNGNLSGTGAEYGRGPSDTSLFASKFSKNLSYDFVTAHRPQFDEACRSSKIALLYDSGQYQIINEQDGIWDNGVWYSNGGYKTYWTSANACGLSGYDDWE